VYAVDIQAEAVRAVADGIRQSGGQAVAERLDVTIAADVKALVERVAAAHGKLDFLFNNAGILVVGEAQAISALQWQRIVDVNVMGVVNGVQAAYPLMVRQRSGHIVNTSSLSGLAPGALQVPYVTTKHAVVGLSKALRAEGAGYGVRVSVVCPGFVDTAIYQAGEFIALDRDKMLGMAQPRSMWLSPARCARAILRGVARNRALILVGFDAWSTALFGRLFPALHLWILTRVTAAVRRTARG
jgi:NAD(P)-dependent dehydrogenase (short-subunit alcohol dehydrogenase family)